VKQLFEETLQLQSEWSHLNTPAMNRRGVLIRKDIPAALEAYRTEIKQLLGTVGADFEIEGRDGTGPKSEVPWVRLYSESRSPSAHTGWYCVYLFRADGSGFYLSIGHAATRYINGEFKPRSSSELQNLVDWAREVLSEARGPSSNKFSDFIDLRARGKLGISYEQGTVWSRFYDSESVPDEQDLLDDLRDYIHLLRNLYDLDDLGRSITNPNEQVAAAEVAVSAITSPERTSTYRGQGFGLTADERRAVEKRAMKVAADHLEKLGFEVEDVSNKRPFDFIAVRGGEAFIVEVKGMTSNLGSIVLTANEVAAHRQSCPLNMLIIVHSISLQRQPPRASGGLVHMICPWQLDESALSAISYKYSIGQ
jgi:hypothetical protein